MDLELLLKKDPKDITSEERNILMNCGICNGYGPKSSILLHWILNHISPALDRASANWHDVAYYIGGTEVDRIRADTGFFRYMLIDINRFNRFKYMYYGILGYIYFFFVRLFGNKSFTYKKPKA